MMAPLRSAEHEVDRTTHCWDPQEIWERPPSTQETSMMGPWEAMPEIQKRPPSIQEMSMAGPLGGDAGDLGVPTINAENFDGGPLGGGAGDPGVPTINERNVDGGSPRMQCRRSESAHHQPKKHRRRTP
jgi:hypothetical protein